MIGAQALLRTLLASGVDTCFTNPGTSEMHFVAALDDVPGMRAVLTLFEGVATGAADGYGRMAGRPAATLLHLGPGLGNGLANLHNARRARTPIVNIVGDHAIGHRVHDAPLHSDIETVARNVSQWVRTTQSPAEVGRDATDAIVAALGGEVATLVLPADVSWDEGAAPGPIAARIPRLEFATEAIDAVVAAHRSGAPVGLLLGGAALGDEGLAAAARIEAVGVRVLVETFPARIMRGAGRPAFERVNYFGEVAVPQLAGLAHLACCDANAPVSFFAYPGRPGTHVAEGCAVHHLVPDGSSAVAALERLADALGAPATAPARAAGTRAERPSGRLTTDSLAAAVAATLPEGAIVSEEALTGAPPAELATRLAAPHDWLTLTGGAIGQGLPVATGAAVACPDRPVLSLQADGSAMYTIQSLWTQAREGLEVTTVILSNRAYAILSLELARVGARTDGSAADLFDLSRPPLDFAALARGMGVPARTATTADELVAALAAAYAEPGPHLIDAVLA